MKIYRLLVGIWALNENGERVAKKGYTTKVLFSSKTAAKERANRQKGQPFAVLETLEPIKDEFIVKHTEVLFRNI